MGRTAAFTSDLKDRWGGAWTTWPGAAKLVAQVARDVSRRADDHRVRLEADTAGGQLHLRATVVDDDGRSQSFRRLRAVVRGPDGYKRDIALEATGTGSYGATLPLERPGAYIAVASDEVSGKPVATTGAALSAGEEMRPTGSDLAMLTRIAELTGGKKRDTLAGIFRDRAARRFAYEDITLPLLLVAAFALLLAVAARRLSVGRESFSWLGKRARAGLLAHEADTAPAPGGSTAKATLDALLASKEQAREQGRDRASGRGKTSEAQPSDTQPEASETPAPAAPVIPGGLGTLTARRAERRQPQPTPETHERPPAAHAPLPPAPVRTNPPSPPTATTATTADADGAAGRKLTAAEILLQRRKNRR
jgi:hypothetical protein